MNPIGYLMQEHRTIEKTLGMFELEIKRIRDESFIDPISMHLSIDFIRTYVDLAHHGKEEDILFRALSKKALRPEHAKIMNDLQQDHRYSRKIVGRWMQANNRCLDGEDTSQEIVSCLTELTQFYPQHIQKEDQYFYDPVLSYFGTEERTRMVGEFSAFDRNILHWKYQKIEAVLKERLWESRTLEPGPTRQSSQEIGRSA
ncbi:MAG: hemerythrin domain-containing protein [Syntrophales bacterium]|nr:hemerythrin domain-containing protein [Syntrophales bacterium]